MFYVYFLKKQNSPHIYIGFTENLQQRIKKHKKYKPGYKLVYYESYLAQEDAREREQKLKKYGSALGHLKRRISTSLERVGCKTE